MHDSGSVRPVRRALLIFVAVAALVLGSAHAGLAIDVVAQGYSVAARGGTDDHGRQSDTSPYDDAISGTDPITGSSASASVSVEITGGAKRGTISASGGVDSTKPAGAQDSATGTVMVMIGFSVPSFTSYTLTGNLSIAGGTSANKNAFTTLELEAGPKPLVWNLRTGGANPTLGDFVRKGVLGAGTYRLSIEADSGTLGGSELSSITASFALHLKLKPHPCADPTAILGGSGPDVLRGTPGDDIICGLAGNDVINGRGGNDLIFGGPGFVEPTGLFLNDGNDKLKGGPGDDELHGGDGNDVLIGGGGHDKLFGEGGDDRLKAKDGSADLVIDGGDGDDTADIDGALETTQDVEHVTP